LSFFHVSAMRSLRAEFCSLWRVARIAVQSGKRDVTNHR
jgi:hypothetical protein